MENKNKNNWASFIHLSTLSQYFIPFGNYIFPILIWSTKKEKSDFIDYNGKQVLNFQLSVFLYSLVLGLIAVPIILIAIFSTISLNTFINDGNFIFNILKIENSSGFIIVALVALFLFVSLKVAEFLLIIYASLKTANGEKYKYPLTLSFIK